jgi:hypothetical protein
VTLLVPVLIVIGDILILVFKRPPRVEGVEEVVECVDFLLGAVLLSKLGNRLDT